MAPFDPDLFAADDQNPYAPPRADMALEPVTLDLTPVPFTVGEVLARTWEIYRERAGRCIGAVCLYLFLMFVTAIAASYVLQATATFRKPQGLFVGLFTNLLFFLFVGWISLGLVQMIVDIARGRKATVDGIFSAGRFLGQALIGGLLFSSCSRLPSRTSR